MDEIATAVLDETVFQEKIKTVLELNLRARVYLNVRLDVEAFETDER